MDVLSPALPCLAEHPAQVTLAKRCNNVTYVISGRDFQIKSFPYVGNGSCLRLFFFCKIIVLLYKGWMQCESFRI